MVEREMQELLWRYPERLLNEPLKQVAWETSSSVGRADLVFEDRHQRLLVVEVKLGKLPRGAIDQLLDYFGMVKERHPDRPVEMMVVANSIPSERRVACENRDIECREISERRFRELAAEVGYIFKSESRLAPESFEALVASESLISKAKKMPSNNEGQEVGMKNKSLYVVVRHPEVHADHGKKEWQNKWRDDYYIESITTTHSLGRRCEIERKNNRLVYIHRGQFPSRKIPSTIICSARVASVEFYDDKAVVQFVPETMLGENKEGISANEQQRKAARRQKFYYLPHP